MKRISQPIIAIGAAAAVLAACDDNAFVPEIVEFVATAAGAYSGTLTDDPASATDFQAIVLDDDSFWMFYGQAGVSNFLIQGFARGTGISDGGAFDSVAATDFGFTPTAALGLAATYDAVAGTIQGTYTTVSGTTTFAGGALPSTSYNYLSPPSLTVLAGIWDVEDIEGTLYTIDVAVDGTFDLAENGGGCTGTGAFTPHDSERGVFAVTVDYDDVVECVNQNGSASGVALAYTYTGAATDQLLAAVTDGETFGMALVGTRPSP